MIQRVRFVNVRWLIRELSKLDPEAVVILQKDAEGNGYEPLAGADSNCVWTDNGDVMPKTITASMANSGFTEEDLGKGITCVVLYP